MTTKDSGKRTLIHNMKRLLVLSLVGFLFSSCAHTIDMNSAHFLTPMTNEKQWGGAVSVSGAKPTKITLVSSTNSNPPARNGVKINTDVSASDLFLLDYVDVDLKLSVYPSVEVLLDSQMFGVKWQFLNHNLQDVVIASAMAGYGMREDGTETPPSKSETSIDTMRVGMSVGYAFERWAPYASYIYDQYNTKTEVTNNFGKFNYKDTGRHHNLSAGVSTRGTGLMAALEFNHLVMNWNSEGNVYQNGFAVQLGYEW